MWIKAFVFCLLLGLCNLDAMAQKPGPGQPVANTTRLELIEVGSTWGYDVFVNDKKYIHQTTIPAVPGTSGFASKSDAKKVGELVIEKIKRNEMPPSVTPEELKKLKINLAEQPKKEKR